MKSILFLSFDLIKKEEVQKPLAISSILSYLKNQKEYGDKYIAKHTSINLLNYNNVLNINIVYPYLEKININEYNFIAISAYVWNEFLTNDLIRILRKEFGYKGSIILGGYQISYSDNLESEYPDCQYFVIGYGEQSILDILTEKTNEKVIKRNTNFSLLPSPYISGEIPINMNQKMVRIETKRGCPYQCTFCAHRDIVNHKIDYYEQHKVIDEIYNFKEKNVKKINILDPIFNAGKDYLLYMNEFQKSNTKSKISLQARFETIVGNRGLEFLNSCDGLNVNLEFGLQTAIRTESEIIKRKNNPSKIKEVMKQLNDRKINYEISLIYGLPSQTLDSFKSSIDFVLDNGCKNIKAFPLMLLKGTELYKQKEKYNFREQKMGDFGIPTVISSNTFSENDWLKMESISNKLLSTGRI